MVRKERLSHLLQDQGLELTLLKSDGASAARKRIAFQWTQLSSVPLPAPGSRVLGEGPAPDSHRAVGRGVRAWPVERDSGNP